MLVGREKIRVFAPEIDGLFEEWPHGREVVRRSRPRPGIVGGGGDSARARDIVGGNPGGPFEVPPAHANEARIVAVVGQGLAMGASTSSSRPRAGSTDFSWASLLSVAL